MGSIRRIEPSSPGAIGTGSSADRDGPPPGEAAVPRPLWTRPSRRESWLHAGPRTPGARLGLGCGLVVVLAIAWFWVGREPATDHAPVPATTVVTRPAPPVETVVSVPRWVPVAIAATCAAHRSEATRVVTVDCTPGRGVAGLQYRGFSSVAAVRAAYGTSSAIAGGSGAAGCARGAPEERSWSSPASPTVPNGRYRCSVVEGRARLVWTSEHSRVLAVASRDDGDLRSLFEWWTTVPGPGGR